MPSPGDFLLTLTARDWVNGLFVSNNTSTQGSSVATVNFVPTYDFETKTENLTILGDKINLSSTPKGDVFYILIHFEDGTSEVARDYTLSGSEITLASLDFNGFSAEVKYLIRKEVA